MAGSAATLEIEDPTVNMPESPGDIPTGGCVLLDLSHHCAETAARREHRRLTTALLAQGGDERKAEASLAVLQQFLEQTDFRKLRAQHPDLAGGAGVCIEVWRPPAGTIRWCLVDREPAVEDAK